MADGSWSPTPSLRSQVSEAEWQMRVDLAALYRLVALHGWDDMVYTHISARLPGPDHHFLINPYGIFFEEMTASSLVKVDMDGQVVQDTPYKVNAAGFTIHSAIHGAREDVKFVMHLHTDQGIAVSAQKEGLLPLSQTALAVLPELAYHDYEGIALDWDERERLVADLGNNAAMLLRNHGTLAVGLDAGDCWRTMFILERACKIQVMALTAGRDKVLIAPEEAQETVAAQMAARGPLRLEGGQSAYELIWPGCLRRLHRELPGFDA
ncbi:class II aldolase/adducin family protein (plasmid) [Sphingobium sp. SJ10-10]|uniref:class II aldolase/adducin family protein n=1 Tax=unclassified Sphingobium TaxID=2611147 RepID=UPI0007701BD8|nr:MULTISPECIES: class II aldolase/adducin family protein [unclassified Sphingobium]AMK25920.1 aldolase II superfamily protein [Sphingobium sp. TKS]MEC6701700.1 class II aldolase/adducin family protein [Sphingobium sp. SJ10-10]